MALRWLIYGALFMLVSTQIVSASEETDALAFIARYNEEAPGQKNKKEYANWDFATNITASTMALKIQAYLKFYKFREDSKVKASAFDVAKLSKNTRRQIEMITIASVPKDATKRQTLTQKQSKMSEIYNSAKVNDPLIGKNLSLEPHLVELMANSRNYSVLLAAWRGWRDVTGPKIRPLYEDYVTLSNLGARDNGFANKGAYWRSKYEASNLAGLVEDIWQQLKPFYIELHAYVRHRLSDQFPQVLSSQPIPAHILGNMWSQSWINIYPLVEPNAGKPSLDVTASLRRQNYTALRIVKLAESFFESIGLGKLPGSFYENSMFERPSDREVVCHAAAADFSVKNAKNERDVRIKQCISITHDDLITTHHELGHVHYYLQYWEQPFTYRAGANPAFHEALGDTIALSVDTPQHLVNIKLLDKYTEDSEADVNALMKMALSKIAFLPFGYMVDQWRWGVYSGEIRPAEYNKKWWNLRLKYQGIKPPVSRDEGHFDPGAKFHIPIDAPYIGYFIGYVLQFQLHKAACKIAGVPGPLHRCSVYNSKAVGEKLSEMLKMGRSKPWQDALEKFTGKRSLDVNPLKEYFQPLHQWLLQQRCARKYHIGWPDTPGPAYDPCNPPTFLPPLKPSTAAAQHSSRPAAHAPKSADLKLQTLVIASLLGCLITIF